jgi:hypothetical protein
LEVGGLHYGGVIVSLASEERSGAIKTLLFIEKKFPGPWASWTNFLPDG